MQSIVLAIGGEECIRSRVIGWYVVLMKADIKEQAANSFSKTVSCLDYDDAVKRRNPFPGNFYRSIKRIKLTDQKAI